MIDNMLMLADEADKAALNGYRNILSKLLDNALSDLRDKSIPLENVSVLGIETLAKLFTNNTGITNLVAKNSDALRKKYQALDDAKSRVSKVKSQIAVLDHKQILIALSQLRFGLYATLDYIDKKI